MFEIPAGITPFLNRGFPQLIGGEMLFSEGNRTMPIYNASTGEVLAHVPQASPADVDKAVRAAAAAQPAWNALGFRGRGAALRRLADLLRPHTKELALLESVNSGNSYSGMLLDIERSIQGMEDWPGMALTIQGATYPAVPGGLHYTTFEPYGVVARIPAYNHPFMFAIRNMCVPLIAGNTVVIKPADQTPASTLAVANLIAEALPPGVVNIVSGGPETGSALVKHPLIKRISFTGSTVVGRRIQQDAASVGVKHVSLELGGKNPMIVFPDADFNEAVQGAITGMNMCVCQGQSCGSNSRTFVHDAIFERFSEALVEELRKIQIGISYRPTTEMGPVVSQAHFNRVMGYIESGKGEGARLITGGGRPPGEECSRGYFIAPTVFTNVDMSMKIAREEIFGPVISLFRWSDYEQVIEQANAVEYGLTASVWTRDLDLAHRTIQRLDAGYCWINDSARHYFGTPFGGMKQSGIGREESVDELYSYLETKTVHVKLR